MPATMMPSAAAVEGICDACGHTSFKRRPDDNAQTVRDRLTVYRERAPIIHYEAQGLIQQHGGHRRRTGGDRRDYR